MQIVKFGPFARTVRSQQKNIHHFQCSLYFDPPPYGFWLADVVFASKSIGMFHVIGSIFYGRRNYFLRWRNES